MIYGIRRLASLTGALLIGIALTACDKPVENASQPVETSPGTFTVLAGSELKDIEPLLMQAAQKAGVAVKVSYAGTLDIVERINAGDRFDAILPPNGAYPSLALSTKPLAREKLFYSRVALGVKASKLKELGWDKRTPTWSDIAKAAGKGQLHYAMTNPATSNTGMSALFAVASAVAGKTEDLSAKEVDAKVLTSFLSGQRLTAGSSGWLAEAFIKDPGKLDALVNYEAVILRANEKLAAADKLTLVYPQDGVISADYPLMLLQGSKRDAYNALVSAWKAAEFQRTITTTAFIRPSIPDVPLAAGLSGQAVAELNFPNSLEVIDTILGNYQGEWRRPATSIFVLDTSGSMGGERLAAMKDALKILAGADAKTASARYARFQKREHVVLLTFSNTVKDPVTIDFAAVPLDQARAQVVGFADNLKADGGTAIYLAMLRAQQLARAEMTRDPGRVVSIVLLTDGLNNAEPNFDGFKQQIGATAPGAPVRVFPITFGEANPVEMAALAQLTGGRVFDGRTSKLVHVFKEIRGYQ
jgi:Ca-activated chloride channel family protein